jgi:periplasmic protein TonB
MSIFTNFIFVAAFSLPQTDTIIPPPPLSLPPPPPRTTEFIDCELETMPLFPACQEIENYEERKPCADKKLMAYIQSELKYPEEAKNNNIQGVTVISFQVDENGNLSDFAIRKKIGGGCEEEALRIVKKMAELYPTWIPSICQGKNVKVRFNVPIRFKLNP